jgi:nucleotide-binding universal stress UspA family protein
MAVVLCPTRGGEASYPNQDRAIQIAKDKGSPILFLYVTDVRFLGRMARPMIVDVEEEINEMGEFLLAMAGERADKAGVVSQSLVLRGAFQDALLEAIEGNDVNVVVLGSPGGETGITTKDYLHELTAKLVDEMAVEVYVVDQGEILEHFAPKGREPA